MAVRVCRSVVCVMGGRSCLTMRTVGPSTLGHPQWRKRFFVLSAARTALLYFKNEVGPVPLAAVTARTLTSTIHGATCLAERAPSQARRCASAALYQHPVRPRRSRVPLSVRLRDHGAGQRAVAPARFVPH